MLVKANPQDVKTKSYNQDLTGSVRRSCFSHGLLCEVAPLKDMQQIPMGEEKSLF